MSKHSLVGHVNILQRAADGVEHQQPMPDAPNPDEVRPWEKVLESYRTDPRIPL
jgi:acyl-CoA thioesterase